MVVLVAVVAIVTAAKETSLQLLDFILMPQRRITRNHFKLGQYSHMLTCYIQLKRGLNYLKRHNTIQAKSAVLRFIPREDHFRLQPRKRSFVLLEFYNVGPAEWFHIKVHDTRGFARSVFRDTRFVRQGTQTAIFLWLWPTAGKYQKGKTDIVIVSVRGRSSNKVSTAIVRMLMT